MTMKQSGVSCLITSEELSVLCRNRKLVNAILFVVLLALDDQSVLYCDQKVREMAQLWMRSLDREHIWMLLLILKGSIRSKKMKPKTVEEALQVNQMKSLFSFDAPIAEGTEQTLHDTYPHPAKDVSEQFDGAYLNRALTDRLKALLDDREFQLLHTMYLSGEGRTLKEVAALNIVNARGGRWGKGPVSYERIRRLHESLLRKLKRDYVLRDLFAEIEPGFV